jgi:hypothetical protein
MDPRVDPTSIRPTYPLDERVDSLEQQARVVDAFLSEFKKSADARYEVLAEHAQATHNLSKSVQRELREHTQFTADALGQIMRDLSIVTRGARETQKSVAGITWIGLFAERHKKLAATVAFLVLVGFNLLHLYLASKQ